MKKIFSTLLSVVCLAVVVTGCASLPEPSEQYNTMIYGIAEYNGFYEQSGTSETKTVTKHSDIKVVLKNSETNHDYTIISNSNGEIIKTGLPEGTYQLIEISTEYCYDNRKWNTTCFPYKDSHAEFKLTEGVLNLGKIYVNRNFSTRQGKTFWGRDLDGVMNYFTTNHPDSQWNNQEWITLHGKVQEPSA